MLIFIDSIFAQRPFVSIDYILTMYFRENSRLCERRSEKIISSMLAEHQWRTEAHLKYMMTENRRQLSKQEKKKAQFQKSTRELQQVLNLLTVFQFHYMLIDLALLVSIYLQLEMETHIFEVLLTFFNLELGFCIAYQPQRSLPYSTYFVSGAFLLVNLLMVWATGFHLHTVTFLFNMLIQGFMVREAISQYYLFAIGSYIVYFLIFANLDGLLEFDIRIVMAVPLILASVLLVKFFREIHVGLSFVQVRRMKRHLLNLLINKTADLGVFLITALPLYWAFVFKGLTVLAATSFICHSFCLLLLARNRQSYLIFNLEKNRRYYRLRPNSFASRLAFVALRPKRDPWQVQLCAKCCFHPARVLFGTCNHFVLCKPCLIQLANKHWYRCMICSAGFGTCVELSRSAAELSKTLISGNESEFNNLFLRLDSIDLWQDDSESDLFLPQPPEARVIQFLKD